LLSNFDEIELKHSLRIAILQALDNHFDNSQMAPLPGIPSSRLDATVALLLSSAKPRRNSLSTAAVVVA